MRCGGAGERVEWLGLRTMDRNEEYKVKLEVFEGPLDLLLYLIKKDELDISNIPMESVTRQYIEYLEMMKRLDLNVAGEFLVMAATLMMIKSRMLLPAEVRPEEEAEEEDPRWDLVRRLVEYKKFKDAALHLEELEVRREDIFGREGTEAVLGREPEVALHDVGLFDLINAFNEALKKVKDEELREIFAERYTVADKIESLGLRLRRERRFSLSGMLDKMRSRNEIACTFLALLELIRLRQARAVQSETYGEIFIERRDIPPEGAKPEDEAPAEDPQTAAILRRRKKLNAAPAPETGTLPLADGAPAADADADADADAEAEEEKVEDESDGNP